VAALGAERQPKVLETKGAKLRRHHRWRAVVFAGVCYTLISVALQHATLRHPFTMTTGSPSVDAHLFIWWLRWTPLALGHGHNPLLTDYMNYPDGVNGVWNTGVVTLGTLAAPLTLTLGPVFTFNMLMVLGPVAAGLAFFVLLRRHVERPWTALVGGAAYGFSPFAVAHLSAAHLNLVWGVLPPLLLLFLDEMFLRQRVRAWALGVAFGVTLVVQAGLYSQTLAIGGLMFAFGAVLVVARGARKLRGRARYALIAAASTVLTFLLLYGYPLYLLWRGPGVPRAPFRGGGHWVGDLANLVVPTERALLRPGTGALAAQMRGYPGEQGLYLGVVVLAVLVATVIVARRPLARLTAIAGLAATVFALGPRLVVLNRDTGIPLPWAVVSKLPLLGHIEPVRFAMFTAFCAAVLLALWLDTAAALPRLPARVAGLALAALALVTIAPRDLVASPLPIPVFFRDGTVSWLVEQGAVVKTVPWATTAWNGGALPLAWQAASGLHYRTTGGYFIGADPTHPVLLRGVADAYDNVSYAIRQGARPPVPDAPQTLAAREVLRDRKVALLVVVPQPQDGTRTQTLLAWTQTVTGRPGDDHDGVWVFDLR
jgi:hypothetical protein